MPSSLQMRDWRLTRAVARRLVVEQDADRRERYPFFRERPPLTAENIEAETFAVSASNAFWTDARTLRPVEETAGVTRGQIITFCVHYSHADICNGGFHQYFHNHTGDWVLLTIDALRVLEEHPRADLMVRAMARFPGGCAPTDRYERQELLRGIDYRSDWRPWIAPIEAAYYALDQDALGDRIHAYQAAHASEYFLDD